MPATQIKTAPYSEGDLFAVPLTDGGWGVVLILRLSVQQRFGSKYILTAGLDRAFTERPTLDDVSGMRPEQMCCIDQTGDKPLIEGVYTRLGPLPSYSRDAWPLPPVVPWGAGGVKWFDTPSVTFVQLPEDCVTGAEFKILPRDIGVGSYMYQSYSVGKAIAGSPHYRNVPRLTPAIIERWRTIADRVRPLAEQVYAEEEHRAANRRKRARSKRS